MKRIELYIFFSIHFFFVVSFNQFSCSFLKSIKLNQPVCSLFSMGFILVVFFKINFSLVIVVSFNQIFLLVLFESLSLVVSYNRRN